MTTVNQHRFHRSVTVAIVATLVATACWWATAALAPTAPVAAADPACGASGAKLTANAVGSATATPDELTLSIGVSSTASSATAALEADNSSAAAVQQSLTASGVKSADIQTVGLSLNPSYDPNGHPNGYSASDTVVAVLRDLSKAGAVIDAAAKAAGNDVRIEGIDFGLSDTSTVDAEARANAVAAAAAHAKAMASAAGTHLGQVCSISDATSQPSPAYPIARAAAAYGANVPLQPGSEKASATVTVTYAIG